MKTDRIYSTQKTYTTYSIENANFTPMFNKLNIFTQVVFVNADVKNHKYTASLSLWRRILHVENNYLYRLRTQFNADKSLIIQTINNIINYNLTNVNFNTKLTFNNETKTLTEWSKQTTFSPQDCLYVYYTYGPDILEKILFANTSFTDKSVPKDLSFTSNFTKNSSVTNNSIENSFTSNFTKNSSTTSSSINSTTIKNNTTVNWQSSGKLITYNNITNNISGWAKLSTMTYNYVHKMIADEPEAFFSKLKEKPNDDRVFKINGIYATYEQWSLFINKPKTYLDTMCYAMGYQYTHNFLYATVVNNQDFITRNKTITINNEAKTLNNWAKQINKAASYLYYLNKTHGLDYTINYINNCLTKAMEI